jgi:hypothetical protein
MNLLIDQALSRAVAVNPYERFHDVLELVFELEHGAMRATPLATEPRSVYERNPLTFWKVTAALLFFALILALHQLTEKHSQAPTSDTRHPEWEKAGDRAGSYKVEPSERKGRTSDGDN